MATTSAKPTLPALKTPVSATYPSELRSPHLPTPTFVKREDGGDKTPITPPAAYVDFLKALSPVLMSPLPTSASSTFTFEERPPTSRTSSASSAATLTSTSTSSSSSSSSADKPASPAASTTPTDSATRPAKTEPDMRVTIPPPSPFVRPMSARTPRLRIPPSPFSAGVRSPLSAHSLHSPYSATMSPGPWSVDGKTKDTRPVSVRQVVTRTVTYSRTPVDAAHVAPLDPAPKGKRRRIK